MLFYLLLTLSVIVLILVLCRENEKQEESYRENFSSRNTPINLYNGINNTNNRANQIKKKLDDTRDKIMILHEQVEKLRMKKKISKYNP